MSCRGRAGARQGTAKRDTPVLYCSLRQEDFTPAAALVYARAMSPHVATDAKNRRYPRVGLPKGMLVAWQSTGERSVSRVATVGLGGLFISTPEPPPAGETVKLFFEVPGGEVRARGGAGLAAGKRHGRGVHRDGSRG